MIYPIPKNSATAWQNYQSKTLQNPGLIFERFAPDWNGQATLKKEGLEAVRKAAEKTDKALLAAWNFRWEADVRTAHAQPFPLKTDWRFITGLGSKGPLEVGFTFHRYGFPILPGSSVKGVARAWGLLEIAKTLKTEELNKLEAALSEGDDKEYQQKLQEPGWQETKVMRQFRRIFGTTDAAGGAIFLDALPSNPPKLELDIMNPHYPEYYQDQSGRVAPTDWQSPIPVYFLTVAPQTEFRFAVGWRGQPDEEAQALAQEWLINGLTQLGAGAKTSAGYGYFQSLVTGPKSVITSTVAAVSLPDPAPLLPSLPRKTAQGKIKYDRGLPMIVTAEGSKFFCNWKYLGMDALREKTSVEFEYEEPPDARPRVVKVRKI
ncbi:MAG: type III-B CRISPR module RAMP protein Cmr6 [Anaerolineae bacterium]|nr:type III-B CRISPR module RAMP protein Cmr6 [Anaerolineae bacterium]